MTPEERAQAFYVTHPPPDADWYRDEVLIPALAQAIQEAVAEERAANCKAVCPRCATGEPVLDVEDCRTLGHPPGPCHRYQAPVVTHIRCLAAAIRARGAQ